MHPATSLRRTLLAWLLLPLLVIVPAGAAIQYVFTLRPAGEAFDQALGDTVIAVANFVQYEAGTVNFVMSAETERSIRTDQYDAVYYAVIGADGRLIAGDPPLAQPPFALAPGAWRFYDGVLDAQPVRIGARGVECGGGACQVRVAETRIKRDRVHSDALLGTVLAMLVFAAASMVTIVVGTGRAMRPLARLRDELGARSLDDLRALPTDATPTELLVVVDAVNRLFGRLKSAASAQQAFIADAAHQLRTPLAALKTDAELALLEPHPAALAPTLHRLQGSAQRAARLASQLLALARAEAGAAAQTEPLDLEGVAADSIDEWLPRAIERDVDLGFELRSAPVRGRAFLLRELLANLIHNALAYAGRGARVTVRTFTSGAHAVLQVEDDGPGIAADEREQVFERFQRGRASQGDGSGLGLAIVRDIAVAHGGSARIEPGAQGRGALFTIELPLAPRPADSQTSA